jgi:hypothetical protein
VTMSPGTPPQGQGGGAPSREYDMNLARVAADRIAQRVRNDPQFTAQLVANPRQTLEAEGLPTDAVNDIIGPAGRLPVGQADAAQPRCMFSIGCLTTQCCLSISVCCFSGSC